MALHIQTSEFANTTNLPSLALFICHLFMNGKFQYGHFLYDSRVFNDHLTVQINSDCPLQKPWLVTDISTVFESDQPNAFEHTDHILQLIFFDPAHLIEQIAQFNDYLTFYRIFAFSTSTSTVDAHQLLSVISEMSPIFNSRPLILQYNPKIDVVQIQWTLKNQESTVFEHGNVNVSNAYEQKANVEGLFDRTFGAYDRERWIEIRIPGIYRIDNGHKMVNSLYGQLYIGNFFLSRLKYSYINMTLIRDDGSSKIWPNRVVVQMPHKFYRDISIDYEPFDVQHG